MSLEPRARFDAEGQLAGPLDDLIGELVRSQLLQFAELEELAAEAGLAIELGPLSSSQLQLPNGDVEVTVEQVYRLVARR